METIAACLQKWIDQQPRPAARPRLLFVSGAQGIGKTTALRRIAQSSRGRILMLSLDDFYLTRDERLQLAATVHPLFETRGPPGTHDLTLLGKTLDALLSSSGASSTLIPVFDKSIDDRVPNCYWREVTSQPELILVEGWMMGVSADREAGHAEALNEIEIEDGDGIWRQYQEACLASEYPPLWDRADGYFHLEAPDFETVLGWRLQQEKENMRVQHLSPERTEWVSRFILHYERLTRRMLNGDRRAGEVVKVDKSRNVVSMRLD